MSFRNMDNQQLLLWAAVAFAIYWIFFRDKQEFYNQPHQHHHVPYHEALTPTEQDANILGISPPPPDTVPQYAPAYTM